MQVSGSLLFSHTLSHSIWLFEFGMSFSMRLVLCNTASHFYEVVIFGFVLRTELIMIYTFCQGVRIVFKVGLALLKFCHDDLVSYQDPLPASDSENPLLTLLT